MNRPASFVRLTPRLPVGDLDRTVRFYQETLGFDVDFMWPDVAPTFVMLTRGPVEVAFYTATEHNPASIGSAELYFEVSNAMAVHDTVSRHVAVEWGPEVYTYGRREFAIRDPDNYLIIFTEPTDDPATTDEP